MKTIKRPIYFLLALTLLAAAMPATAAASASSTDHPAFDIFARIEAALAEAWAFTAARIGPDGSPVGADVERADATGRIGPTGEPVGGAAPQGDPPGTGGDAPPQETPGS